MKNLNSIILEGNCVREPNVTITAKGTTVCTFAVASHRTYKIGEIFAKEVSFFDIEAWGKLAERVSHQCKKGRGVRVVGRLKQNRWEGSDGKKNSKIRIVAENIEFKPETKQQETSFAKNNVPVAETKQTDEIAVF
ncbi:MAG: single-stranded DNA-binding protein [Treponema sp.]|jgi:single-strand DNA-binding protein|nr:single-stranded DNA-binding protein [Treponema sp.]